MDWIYLNRMLRLVFCISVLLVSLDNHAQGIVIEDRAYAERTLYRPEDYESVYYQASAQYRLQDTNLYLSKNVQAIELSDADNRLVFKVIFDHNGKVVHLVSVGKSRSVLVSTDVFPDQQKQLTVTRYHNNDELLRVDTSLLEQVTQYRRNKPPLQYSKETYTSYKRGRYLAERNDYYKGLLADGAMQNFIILSPVYISTVPAKRIDGNADRPFRWPETEGSRLLLRREVEQDQFYHTQERKTYSNISGASPLEEQRLLNRSSVQYFKEGENYACRGIMVPVFRPSNWCGYGQHAININSGPVRLAPYVQTLHQSNEQGLTDSIVQVTYTQQADDKPCLLPLDANDTLYLKGYAGRPEETRTLYTFRYTYFAD